MDSLNFMNVFLQDLWEGNTAISWCYDVDSKMKDPIAIVGVT